MKFLLMLVLTVSVFATTQALANEPSTPVTDAIKTRRSQRPPNLSPDVRDALDKFDAAITKVETKVEALPKQSTGKATPKVDLTDVAERAADVIKAAQQSPAPAEDKSRKWKDVPIYRQPDDTSCGVSSTRWVLHYHTGSDPGHEAVKKAVFSDFTQLAPGGQLVGDVLGVKGFTMPSKIKLAVEKTFKLPCAERRKQSLDAVRRSIDAGRPPILLVRVDSMLFHYVVAVDYDDTTFTLIDPSETKPFTITATNLDKGWSLERRYPDGGDAGDLPGVMAGYKRVMLVVNDAAADDAGAAEFVVEQVVILAMDALRRGADPTLIGDALNILGNAVGSNTTIGKTIKKIANIASKKDPVEIAKASVDAFDDLLKEAGILPRDSKIAEAAQKAMKLAEDIEKALSLHQNEKARKLIGEFLALSKDVQGQLGNLGGKLGMDGEMVPALGFIKAGLKIAEICKKWGDLSSLGKVAAALDGLSSAALAAQAFCSVAVCEVKGPIILLAALLKDLINLGIDLGLNFDLGLGGGGGKSDKKPDGGSGGKPEEKPDNSKSDASADPSSEPSAAATATQATAKAGGTPAQIGKTAAEAVGGGAEVQEAATKAAEEAKKANKDPAKAAAETQEVKAAEAKQKEKDQKAAEKAAKDAKSETPADLAAAAVAADKSLANDAAPLRNLIAAETKPGRTAAEAVRRALARLRADKAVAANKGGVVR